MRIGYIVLCHKDPELVKREIKRVTDGTENIAVVHVDAKSNIEPFVSEFQNNKQVVFLNERINIYWGGFSSIEATMNALEVAVSYVCDRYVLLQGCDFPLLSNESINNFFERNKEVEYIKAYNITRSERKLNYMKCYGYHVYDGVDRQKKSLKTLCARALTGFNKLGIRYRKGYYVDKTENKKYEIYWGWAHFAITKNCAEYLLNVYKTKVGLNRYFKHIFPVDETYLHTIIYNSNFAYRTLDKGAVDEHAHMSNESMLNLTYFEYQGQVREFENMSEIECVNRSKYLYIRKIKPHSELEELL